MNQNPVIRGCVQDFWADKYLPRCPCFSRLNVTAREQPNVKLTSCPHFLLLLPYEDLDAPCTMEEVPLQNCILISRWLDRFPSNTGVLAAHSPVFKDLILGSNKRARSFWNSDLYNSLKVEVNEKSDIAISFKAEDSFSLELLWKYIHGKTNLIEMFEFLFQPSSERDDSAGSSSSESNLDDIINLTRLARTYQMWGALFIRPPLAQISHYALWL